MFEYVSSHSDFKRYLESAVWTFLEVYRKKPLEYLNQFWVDWVHLPQDCLCMNCRRSVVLGFEDLCLDEWLYENSCLGKKFTLNNEQRNSMNTLSVEIVENLMRNTVKMENLYVKRWFSRYYDRGGVRSSSFDRFSRHIKTKRCECYSCFVKKFQANENWNIPIEIVVLWDYTREKEAKSHNSKFARKNSIWSSDTDSPLFLWKIMILCRKHESLRNFLDTVIEMSKYVHLLGFKKLVWVETLEISLRYVRSLWKRSDRREIPPNHKNSMHICDFCLLTAAPKTTNKLFLIRLNYLKQCDTEISLLRWLWANNSLSVSGETLRCPCLTRLDASDENIWKLCQKYVKKSLKNPPRKIHQALMSLVDIVENQENIYLYRWFQGQGVGFARFSKWICHQKNNSYACVCLCFRCRASEGYAHKRIRELDVFIVETVFTSGVEVLPPPFMSLFRRMTEESKIIDYYRHAVWLKERIYDGEFPMEWMLHEEDGGSMTMCKCFYCRRWDPRWFYRLESRYSASRVREWIWTHLKGANGEWITCDMAQVGLPAPTGILAEIVDEIVNPSIGLHL